MAPHPTKMIIYKASCLVTNKIYIGKTILTLDSRKKKHIRGAMVGYRKCAFHNAIRKYGEEEFVWEVLDYCIFSDLLLDLEKFYIKKYNSKVPNGYNLTDGGEGLSGHKFSKAHRERLSMAHRGKGYKGGTPGNKIYKKRMPMSEEQKRKISTKLKGRPIPLETRKKLSIAMMGNKNSAYGRKYSDEERLKMSIAVKNGYEKKRQMEQAEERILAL